MVDLSFPLLYSITAADLISFIMFGFVYTREAKLATLISILTINAPLILKMRDIIFFLRANYIMGHFKGYFEGDKTFLTPKLSRAQQIFKNQRCIGIFMSLCDQSPYL